MPYPIKCDDKIEYGLNKPKLSYQKGLEMANNIGTYLNLSEAVLVVGPGDVSSKTIEMWNNAGDWVYRVLDSTLFLEIRPGCDDKMFFNAATAGKNSKKVISALNEILKKYL